MRRRPYNYTLNNSRLIFRGSGCLLLVLIPIVVLLACGLFFQTIDLMTGKPIAASPQRLVRRPVAPAGNFAANQAIPVAAVAGQSNEVGGSPNSLEPIRHQRLRLTPTPEFLPRLVTALVNIFGEATPTPVPVFTAAPTVTPTTLPTDTPVIVIPSPTATTTPFLQPSPTALSTATATPLAAQVSAATTVNVRAGPGTNYPVVGSLSPNTLSTITGRNQDSSWWQISQANSQTGWVAAWVVEARNAVDVPVVPAPPPPQPAISTDPPPAPAETPSPTPLPVPEYDFILAEFYNSPTNNSFLTVYVAIVDPKEIPIGGIKAVGTRLDHNLAYDSPLSTWHYEGYSAPGEVIKSGNVKFEPPGGIETTSWVIHLEDEYGNRQSEDVSFDVDVNDKQWYFIKFRRKF